MKDNTINNTIVNDIHRELEFIDKSLPMSQKLCDYLFTIQRCMVLEPNSSLVQNWINIDLPCKAKRLLNEQVQQITTYYNKN